MVLDGGMSPHVAVHGRGHNQGTAAREQHGRQDIIRQSDSGLGQEVGRRRRDHDGIGPFRDGQMFHLLMSFEEVGRHRLAGQDFKSHRRDELSRSPGHHDGDAGPLSCEGTQEAHSLIRRDAPCDAERHPFTGQRPWRRL